MTPSILWSLNDFFLSFQKDIKVLAILALLIYTEIHIVKKQVVGICKKWEQTHTFESLQKL